MPKVKRYTTLSDGEKFVVLKELLSDGWKSTYGYATERPSIKFEAVQKGSVFVKLSDLFLEYPED